MSLMNLGYSSNIVNFLQILVIAFMNFLQILDNSSIREPLADPG